MVDKEFDDAKIIYEIFTKRGKILKEVSLDQIANSLNLSTPRDKLLERLRRLEKGLPVEDKFISLAVWMNNCKVVHKLEQEQFPASSSNLYQVPDLLAIFNYKGHEVPVLIEVKSDGKERQSMSDYKISLSNRLYKKLTNYAKKTKLPLLIAWQAGENWTLFDVRQMKKKVSAYHISWDEAIKEDLMFTLLGNLYATAIPHVRFKFTFKEVDTPDSKSLEENKRKYRLVKGGFENPKGKPIKKSSRIQYIIWTLTNNERKDEQRGNERYIILESGENQTLLPTYALLPYFLFWISAEETRPANWYEANKMGHYGDISFSEVEKALKDGMGKIFQDIIQLVPTNMPDFLLAFERDINSN